MDYELYHDESLEGGYWHGILFVPAWKKQEYIELLAGARKNLRYENKLGIKNVKQRGRVYDCASAWLQIGLACLRSSTKGKPMRAFLGRRDEMREMKYENIDAFGMKFILFRERDAHKTMDGRLDHASKIETTFRFALKGGLHRFGSEEEPIRVTKIHFDGYEHMQRNIDQQRIIGRLDGLRPYCQIDTHAGVIDDRHSDHDKPDAQEPDDCQLLQLTDLLIGSFRTSLGYKTREIHAELSRPVKTLLDAYNQGPARMRNSRWFNSFLLSQCYLEENRWHFEPIKQRSQAGVQPKML
jgi:hypothetical protein